MLKEYKESGFYLAKNLLNKDYLSSVRNDIMKVFAIKMGKHKVDDKDLFDLYQFDRASYVTCAKQAHNLISLHQLACNELIVNMLHDFGVSFPSYAAKPVILFSAKQLAENHHFYWKAKPHQDWAGLMGSLDSVVAWLPLVPFTKELGFLEIVPGSHLSGLLKHVPSGPTVEISEEHEYDFQPIPMELGDVLFFSTFSIHRSGENISDLIRLSVNFRYDNNEEINFAERCFPNSFVYNRVQLVEQIPGFPKPEDIQKVFK